MIVQIWLPLRDHGEHGTLRCALARATAVAARVTVRDLMHRIKARCPCQQSPRLLTAAGQKQMDVHRQLMSTKDFVGAF